MYKSNVPGTGFILAPERETVVESILIGKEDRANDRAYLKYKWACLSPLLLFHLPLQCAPDTKADRAADLSYPATPPLRESLCAYSRGTKRKREHLCLSM